MKALIRSFIPQPILDLYHLTLAHLGAFVYRYPSRQLVVVAVTGTKGKSTTAELIHRLLTECGYKSALASTIRFAIGEDSERNLYKMTMPGRFFMQRFLRRAVSAGCTHAVIEMTSEGARQFRHKGIALNALVFTNLAPEHLESHGGLLAYVAAKLHLARHLEVSPKRPRIMVANADDEYGQKFLEAAVDVRAPFSLHDAEPYSADDKSVRFLWRGGLYAVPLPGLFNLYNCLAALALGQALGLPAERMKRALEHTPPIAGRAERIFGAPFAVIVDYAHTPESLKALFETYKGLPGQGKRMVCVLGSTGGGRDTWKRPLMGKLAEAYCDSAILTNEDPYDEDPQKILNDIAKGFSTKKPRMILERRVAIREALREAKEGDVVLLTGKGTDPFIMGPRGGKLPWSDAEVAQEELVKLGYH